ncbi:MAG: ABC transporter ATP-binding protein [Beijerinckiaceae bacterium]|nr:ABC transporter ATP-binding protein [Beijerinckiaceae bacterium]
MIRVRNLRKSFTTKTDLVHAVDGVSFDVANGETVTLLGPSGCGKTTTLRCIAGLEKGTAGTISIDEKLVANPETGVFTPPHKRELGMVFQSYAIWPHMNVSENVSYALEGRSLAKGEIARRTRNALEIVKMAHLADRPAPRLSGGQQQRVAIARALVSEPKALLFDEPLSNLDAQLRAEMRKELRRLQQQIGMTSVYVTHDQAEALAISDWIIVMKDGRIIERGRPADIYRNPNHVFTARFLGTSNLMPGKVAERRGAHAIVDTQLGHITGVCADETLTAGDNVEVAIRPEDIDLLQHQSLSTGEASNNIDGIVALMVFAGAITEAEVACNGVTFACLLPTGMATGEPISLSFRIDRTRVLRAEAAPGAQGDAMGGAKPAHTKSV